MEQADGVEAEDRTSKSSALSVLWFEEGKKRLTYLT